MKEMYSGEERQINFLAFLIVTTTTYKIRYK